MQEQQRHQMMASPSEDLSTLLTDVQTLIQQEDWEMLQRRLTDHVPADVADLLFTLETRKRVVLFRLLPRAMAAEVFSLLVSDAQRTLLDEFTQEEARHVLAALEADDRTQLFGEMPGEMTQRLLNVLSPQALAETRRFLGYAPESVGRLMTPRYVAVRPDWTIGHALEQVRAKGTDSETVDVLYVVDGQWRLLDALDLRRFILTDVSLHVRDIMDNQYVFLTATQDREEAVRQMRRHDLAVLPVVDSANILLGIVTFDDVLDVAQAEATEDFHKGAAVAPLRGSYRDARFPELYRKRVGWLLTLVLMNVFSGAVIANFEDVIAANVALVFFLPLLIDSSGNAGSQSATLMVRALATNDVQLRDWWRLLVKELSVAGGLALTMALAVSVMGFVRGGPGIALVVSLTMTMVVMVGSTMGVLLPFLLTRLKLDPATASAPLVTSLADITGVLIYFSVATQLLRATG